MELSTLYWYIFTENWLDLSSEQLKLLSDIEDVIGSIAVAKIFENLSLKSATGEELRVLDLSSKERDKLSKYAMKDLRELFTKQVFRAMFQTTTAPEFDQRTSLLLAKWCNYDKHQMSLMLDATLGVSQRADRCRDFLGM